MQDLGLCELQFTVASLPITLLRSGVSTQILLRVFERQKEYRGIQKDNERYNWYPERISVDAIGIQKTESEVLLGVTRGLYTREATVHWSQNDNNAVHILLQFWSQGES